MAASCSSTGSVRFRAWRRRRCSASLLTRPVLVGDLGRFSRMTGMAAATPRGSGRETIWWLITSPRHGYATSWVLPGWVGHVAHPLILLVAVPLSLLFLRRGGA